MKKSRPVFDISVYLLGDWVVFTVCFAPIFRKAFDPIQTTCLYQIDSFLLMDAWSLPAAGSAA